MRSLVTGGAGFIGSHLVTELVDRGHSVVVLDNFSTGRPENLAHIARKSEVQVIRVDTADHAAIARHFTGVDWVFHLAALADIVPSISQPLAYHKSNVEGTVSVLEAARLAGVRRVVYAASSSCYGVADEVPTPETAEIRPQFPYALTKWVGEQYVLHWARVYRLPAMSLRLFNVYGPRSRTSGTYGAVFGVLLAQKLHGQPFTVVGDGSQRRDFIFVSDVVSAFIAAAASEVTGEVMNVGSGQPHSVNELVELLDGSVVHIPKRPGEPDVTHADIRRIQQQLGWVPRVPFERGVRTVLEHIDSWREAPVWTPATIEAATQDWFMHLSKAPVASLELVEGRS